MPFLAYRRALRTPSAQAQASFGPIVRAEPTCHGSDLRRRRMSSSSIVFLAGLANIMIGLYAVFYIYKNK